MLKKLLKENQFITKKSLGQNFITDRSLLDAIVADSQVKADDIVLEIGAGGGTLTRALCRKVKKVHAFEIDKSLQPILMSILEGIDNYELHFKDPLKMQDEEIMNIVGARFNVVANLPYYITTPLIMKFLESRVFEVATLTFMMQKEVAKRICAKESTPEYGVLTLAVQLRGKASITRYVSRNCFFPKPNVDSAVVRIEICNKYSLLKIQKTMRLIKIAFAMRRKTLLNNIVSGYGISKKEALALFRKVSLGEKIRGEALTLHQFLQLSELLAEI